jgi:hypothetical protein
MKNLMCLGLVALVVASACGKKDETPPPAAGGVQGANGQYPQGQPGQYPQGQPGQYPQGQPGQPGAYPQPGPNTPAPGPGPAPAPQLATPGPLALPCTNDAACVFARCNTQYGKCAFPCLANTDCNPGHACNAQTGACLPGGG